MGTVNIQSEINGGMKTYGYSEVGDVFGILSFINYGLKLDDQDLHQKSAQHKKLLQVLRKREHFSSNVNSLVSPSDVYRVDRTDHTHTHLLLEKQKLQ